MTIATDPHAAASMRRQARRHAVDSLALLVGTAVNGVLAYVFFALATRTLGAGGAAPVAQLWTWWSASAAILTFPVQHWIIRVARTEGGVTALRRALPRVAALVAGLGGLVGLVSWVARQQLFLRDDLLFPLCAAAVTVGAFVVGVVRGRLAASDRFVATGTAIAGENVLRVALALVLVAQGAGAGGFGIALAAGAAAVLVWPSAFRFPAAPGARDVSASPLVFLGGIAGGSLIAQVVLTGGPVVLAAIGGAAAEVTGLFAALAVFRAPYLLTLGLVTQVTGALTDLVVGARHRTLRRTRRMVVTGAFLGAAAAWGLGSWVGPGVITLVFGSGVAPPPTIVALIAAATAVALANLILTVLLVARAASGALTMSWVTAVGAAAVVVAGLPLAPLPAVAWAFLAAETTAFALMWWTDVRRSRVARQTVPTGR